MDIGDRIKKRREELGMSQEELAKKVGYKSRSSVNKIEIDGRGLPQNKIVIFAKALETTPAYLMGWNDETIEIKYNTLSSCDSENLNRYADYLYMRERQLITDSNSKQYLDFIIAEKVQCLSDIGKKKVFSYASNLLDLEVADEELNAAHARTDIDIPEDADTSENDIMDDEDF
jgi:transcriptional regulator with XRE-family HTH domain